MPVPVGAAWSIAQPPTVIAGARACPVRGESSDIAVATVGAIHKLLPAPGPAGPIDQAVHRLREGINTSVATLKKDGEAKAEKALRERLNLKRNARQYAPAASAVAALLGLGMGYSLAGIFTRK